MDLSLGMVAAAMSFMLISLPGWLAKVGSAIRDFAFNLQGPGLFLVALADSSFLTIPEGNDLLIVVLSTGNSWERMAYYVGMTTLGSLAGCLLLYLVGRRGGNPLLRRRFSEANIARVERLFDRYGVLTIAVPCLLPPPCPFKIFVLSAGVFRLSVSRFLTAVAIGRTVRYSMWGILAVLYGNSVKIFMQQHLTRIGMMLFGFFLLCCLAGLAFLIYRSRRAKTGVEA
jgi:membrane protein DedA with SNARE-associated domain